MTVNISRTDAEFFSYLIDQHLLGQQRELENLNDRVQSVHSQYDLGEAARDLDDAYIVNATEAEAFIRGVRDRLFEAIDDAEESTEE